MDEGTFGLCECGCGQPTRVAKQSDPRYGHVKGQPVPFLKGHSHRGKVVSAETRAKIGAGVTGERQGHWKGDEVSYRALHAYLCVHYPKSGVCDECGNTHPRTEFALIKGRTYSRNRDDYRELCHRCHGQYDLGGTTLSPEARAKVSAGGKRRWREQKAR